MSDDGDRPDYEVGYGRPPKHSRFQKGVSGNPSGRLRGARSIKSELEAELAVKVPIKENGRRKRLTKRQIATKALVHKAMNGDVRAYLEIARLVSPLEPGQPLEPELSVEDEALLRDYLNRRAGKPGGEGGEP